MLQVFENVGIESLISCVPQNVISNDFFSELLNEKERRVFEKTVNILERRWVGKETTASDLGFYAATNLFEETGQDLNEISCLIFLSQTADYKIPFTSNILQDRLKLPNNIICLDINAGCAGFIQGLSTAFAITKSLNNKKTLLIVAETLSKILSPNDRSTTMLFGDAASAMLISNNDKFETTYIDLFSDGSSPDVIMIPDGGYRNAFNSDSLDSNKTYLHMQGQKVFDFTMREIAPSIIKILNEADLSKEDIDLFLLHQSNAFIINQIANLLGVDKNKFPKNIQKFGNTSGVSIPLLISDFKTIIDQSNNVVLSGYGSGLNWGNAIIKLKHTKILDLKIYN